MCQLSEGRAVSRRPCLCRSDQTLRERLSSDSSHVMIGAILIAERRFTEGAHLR